MEGIFSPWDWLVTNRVIYVADEDGDGYDFHPEYLDFMSKEAEHHSFIDQVNYFDVLTKYCLTFVLLRPTEKDSVVLALTNMWSFAFNENKEDKSKPRPGVF